MKPKSIRLFDRLYLSAVGFNVVSAVLGWKALADRAGMDLERASRGSASMSGWLVGSSIFLFVLIALVLWAAVSQFRAGLMRWVIAAIVIYGASDAITMVRSGHWAATGVLNLLAIVCGLLAAVMLFRADARAWFAASPDHPLPLD